MTRPAVFLCRTANPKIVDETRFVVGQLAGPGTYRCERCGKDAGLLPMERDDHCPACWDALEAEEVKTA